MHLYNCILHNYKRIEYILIVFKHSHHGIWHQSRDNSVGLDFTVLYNERPFPELRYYKYTCCVWSVPGAKPNPQELCYSRSSPKVTPAPLK
jgi:hypothetical protein